MTHGAMNNRENMAHRRNVRLSEGQRTRLRHDFIETHRGPRAEHVNFHLDVGVHVPRTMRVVAVPQEIVEIDPAWDGDEYFVSGDQIVIGNTETFEIVAVLPV